MEQNPEIKLTQFSSGSGCGCKIAPADLENILCNISPVGAFDNLLVGNGNSDDAAVMLRPNGEAIISSVDFFMPIVDNARDFGKIAAANALSDIYAMGGTPLMAVAMLGWPIEQLGTELAAEVINGAQEMCTEAGIPLAGGHSINSKEPIFGLSVTGIVKAEQLKRNHTAQAGDLIYLTKSIGVGIVSTAMKRGKAEAAHIDLITKQMTALNSIGADLAQLDGVTALTDLTGFGLVGHLLEMCDHGRIGAEIDFLKLPTLGDDVLDGYLKQFIMPDNTMRNFKAFQAEVSKLDAKQLQLLCDPQTNGGLLIAVSPEAQDSIESLLKQNHCYFEPIGKFVEAGKNEKVIQLV